MVYGNNGDFTEISTYYHGITFDLLELMQFNNLHLSYRFTASFTKLTQIYMKI